MKLLSTYLLLVTLFSSWGCGIGSRPGKEKAADLVNAYLSAVQKQDRGALEGLYSRDGGSEEHQAVEEDMDRRLRKYRGMRDASFHVTFLGNPVAGYICYARITARGPNEKYRGFKDDLYLVLQSPYRWTLSPSTTSLEQEPGSAGIPGTCGNDAQMP